MNTKKVVCICFNAMYGNGVVRSVVRTLAHEVARRFDCTVTVSSPYRTTRVDVGLGIRSMEAFGSSSPHLCLFVTSPFVKRDSAFVELLKEASRRGLNRHAFVLKADGDKLVPPETFTLFRLCATEYANAIRSPREIFRWVEDNFDQV